MAVMDWERIRSCSARRRESVWRSNGHHMNGTHDYDIEDEQHTHPALQGGDVDGGVLIHNQSSNDLQMHPALGMSGATQFDPVVVMSVSFSCHPAGWTTTEGGHWKRASEIPTGRFRHQLRFLTTCLPVKPKPSCLRRS